MALLRNNRLLWTLQFLLAALFLFAGGVKLVMPAEALAAQSPQLSPLLLKFVGTMEVLGALGLVLPGLTGIRPHLTSLAAAGLVVIMIGATTLTAATMGVLPAVFPFVVGVLVTAIAVARRETRVTQVASV
jgi:hypothetical protein